MHNRKLICRRFPNKANAVIAALAVSSTLLLIGGVLLLVSAQ
jgi:hypothetical protein